VVETATEEFGPYLVYEQLGIGGMASVHRAEVQGSLGFARSIALKRMLPQVATSADMVRAFVREARLASHLRHENVAQTYELGKVGDTYFIAMELVVGRNLHEILKQCSKGDPMPVPIALNILNQICDALDYAHNLADETGQPLGIIHRDVTPSNIIVSDGGVVKLIDFGIAKASAAGMQTMSGTIKGKFGYMAPEYIAGSIDARADLFALGVIAHELLTNRPLFAARDDRETLARVQSMEVRPPSHRNPAVPLAIDEIVMTALSRDPERRWQQATALRGALTTVTRRLGLTVLNSKVIEWVENLFDRTDPNRAAMDSHASMTIQAGTVELPTSKLGLVSPAGTPAPPLLDAPRATPPSISVQRPITQPVARTSAPRIAVTLLGSQAPVRISTKQPAVPMPAVQAHASSRRWVLVLAVLAATMVGAAIYFVLQHSLGSR
jgi:serine/threonine protein kinase